MNSTNILTTAKIQLKYVRNDPWWYFIEVIFTPFSILIPLFILAPEHLIDIAMGSVIFSSIVTPITEVSNTIIYSKHDKSINFFITRPVTPAEWVLGIALGTLLYNLVGACVIMAFCVLIGLELGVFQLFSFLLVIVCAWFISSILGFIIGNYGPEERHHNSALASMASFTLAFLAPVYYPLSALPSFMHPLAYCSYTTHLALIGKGVLNGTGIPIFSLIAVIGFLSAGACILNRIRWKE